MFLLPDLSTVEPAESVSLKCTTCKVLTKHDFVKIQPEHVPTDPEKNPSPLELLKLTKRLSMCTECGTLRLTN